MRSASALTYRARTTMGISGIRPKITSQSRPAPFFNPPTVPILTLAQELGVAVGKEVDDGSCVGLGAANVLFPDLGGDERPAESI